MLAVESKWTGRSVPTTESILWDLVRLELIAHHGNARCIFLLAGTASRLAKVFEDPAFADAATKPHRRPVLRHDNNVVHSIPLVPLVPVRFELMTRMLEPYREFRFPEYIATRRTAPVPEIAKRGEYQVFGWEVLPLGNRTEFRPGRSKYFAA